MPNRRLATHQTSVETAAVVGAALLFGVTLLRFATARRVCGCYGRFCACAEK